MQPGFKSEQHAWVINPFVKVGGLELLGNIETATGRNVGETTEHARGTRTRTKALYRFLGDKVYVGGRYNTVNGRYAGMTNDVSVDRYQLGGGWFITPTVLLKGEWMNAEVQRLPDDRHPQRRQDQGLHGRGRRRLLTTASKESGGATGGRTAALLSYSLRSAIDGSTRAARRAGT